MRLLICFITQITSLSCAFGQVILKGEVKDERGPIPWAIISELGTNMPVFADATGKFELKLDTIQETVIEITATGYLNKQVRLSLADIKRRKISIELSAKIYDLKDIEIQGKHADALRDERSLTTSVLNSKTLELTQSANLAEGLCFQPGLRMETDCQTCGYSQIRMNGMGGSYTQILVNSRAIFPSLMSLYGLEQFPAGLIDRVEVVKGGGSVTAGVSAIAGTVNIITKAPVANDFSIGLTQQSIDEQRSDTQVNGFVQRVAKNKKSGATLLMNLRRRDHYDANEDGFSELPMIQGATLGASAFHNSSKLGSTKIQFFTINEKRQGGNKIGKAPELADQGEFRLHHMFAADVSQNIPMGKHAEVLAYAAWQTTWRSHYTGIDQADGWGLSRSTSQQAGLRYIFVPDKLTPRKPSFIAGLEAQQESTKDEVRAYNYLIDQEVSLSSAFVQSEWQWSRQFLLTAGYRLNHSNRLKTAIGTPRLTLLWKPLKRFRFQTGYSRGFKVPQAFEADMHMAFASGGVSTIRIDSLLKPERSESIQAEFVYEVKKLSHRFQIGISGFSTQLKNTFILEEIDQDILGNQVLFRTNGASAFFRGITLEMEAQYEQMINIQSGFTIQKAYYVDSIAWSNELPGETQLLRTPTNYGFAVISLFPDGQWEPSLNFVYTGRMLVPHFAGAPGINEDRLKETPNFLNASVQLRYRSKIVMAGKPVQFALGIHNVFNAYQSDFDIGKNRDSNYVYGPMRPRTFTLQVLIN